MKRSAIAIVSLAVVLVTPVTATAKMIHHEHHRETFEVDNTICGEIQAHSVWDVVWNDAVRLSLSGFPLYSGGVGRGTVTFTDTATGNSVSFAFSGTGFRDLRAIDNGDGTFTRYGHVSGTESMIVAGVTVDRWSGQFVYRSVVDYNDTPANGDDDTFLSDAIVRSSGGPHSELLNGCAVLEQA